MERKREIIMTHWSTCPIGEVRPCAQGARAARGDKPDGFWVSDESEESDGWRKWCAEEGFCLERLKYRTEFLVDLESVLLLPCDMSLREFTRRYYADRGQFHFEKVDWFAVARDHKGIVITPYQWADRLDIGWYYTWDCASGCFWDVTCLKRLSGSVLAEECAVSTPAD